MQAIEAYMIAIRELIDQPEDTVHIEPFSESKRAQGAITRQQSPPTRFSYGERKCVWNRELGVLPVDSGCTPKLD